MEHNRISDFSFPEADRRKYKRFPFVFPIKYTYLGKNPVSQRPSEFSLYSFSNNISRGGMMLTISNNVPVDEYLDLVITLPVEHDVVSIHAVARIKWINREDEGYLAGVEFHDIMDRDLAVIQKLLDTDKF